MKKGMAGVAALRVRMRMHDEEEDDEGPDEVFGGYGSATSDEEIDEGGPFSTKKGGASASNSTALLGSGLMVERRRGSARCKARRTR